MYSLQDYSIISNLVKKYGFENEIEEDSIAFYFFALELLLGLQDDEITDSITDNFYLKKYGEISGHDRGIDAVYIDSSKSEPMIHFFNFKYAISFEKTKDFIESNEIDKIINFIGKLMSKDTELKKEINPMLYSKSEEIWDIFNRTTPKFTFHICSNYYESFEKNEKEMFERSIQNFSNFTVSYDLMPKLVDLVTKKGKVQVSGKIKAIDKNFFEKSDGEIRALIVNLDARDVIRLIIENEELRNLPDFSDYDKLKNYKILEDAFDDNVRLYLKHYSKINNNIITTALSEDNHKFFYYNNGITITCDYFSYPKSVRAPIIEIINLQVVNGGQTLHALYEALCKNSEKAGLVNLLCRIYETRDKELSSRIAEYTNSQNPVNNRDIHSIDIIQIKFEKDFETLNYYYERKKNQFSDKQKDLRIDLEKAGQSLLAFYQEMPSEAKNNKRIIFGEKYDDIFNDNLTINEILLSYKLYEKIEKEKSKKRKMIIEQYEEYGYLSYCTYWILFLMKKFSEDIKIELKYDNIEQIWNLYDRILIIIESFINKEKSKSKPELYTHSVFFKYNSIKKYFEDFKESDEYTKLIKEIKYNNELNKKVNF